MRRERYTSVLIILLFALESVFADSWIFPKERYRSDSSENGTFAVYLTPPKGKSDSLLEVIEIKDQNEAILWKRTLKGQYLPMGVYVTNDGGNVVTVNQIGFAGYGDYVMVFYNANGLIKNYSMEEILHLPKNIEDSELRKLVPHSTSSRWWDRHSVKFFDASSGKLHFCIWLGVFNRWTAWDATNGQEIKPDDKMISRWNTKARMLSIKRIKEGPQGRRLDEQDTPFVFLSRLKRPEDRKYIEQLLSNNLFLSGVGNSKRGLLHYTQCSSRRSFAERLLAKWDGKSTEIHDPFGYDRQIYYHLGVIDGVVKLPQVPKVGDGKLWVFLVPDNVARNRWRREPPTHRLVASFNKHLLSPYNPKASRNFLFSIEGITPGKYWLKAVWDKAKPRRKYYALICRPKQGDYESIESPVITIEAGKIVEDVIIDCTHKVGNVTD